MQGCEVVERGEAILTRNDGDGVLVGEAFQLFKVDRCCSW